MVPSHLLPPQRFTGQMNTDRLRDQGIGGVVPPQWASFPSSLLPAGDTLHWERYVIEMQAPIEAVGGALTGQ